MSYPNVVTFPDLPRSCGECPRAPKCIGLGLEDDELPKVLKISARTRIIHKNEKLFNDGDPFQFLYVVRSGAIKTYKTTEAGDEQVMDFCLPGDLIGLNSLGSDVYQSHAVALNTTSVCIFDIKKIEQLCEQSPLFQKKLLARFGSTIRSKEHLLVTLGTCDAYQRLAAFLLMLSDYYQKEGYSCEEFVLPMSRADIAEYLMLAVETVSRLFSRLQAEECVKINRNTVYVTNMEKLFRIAKVNPRPIKSKMNYPSH